MEGEHLLNSASVEEYKKGLQEGVQQGELTALRLLLQKRFGSLPNWVEERLRKLTAKELEDLIGRTLEAPALDELLR